MHNVHLPFHSVHMPLHNMHQGVCTVCIFLCDQCMHAICNASVCASNMHLCLHAICSYFQFTIMYYVCMYVCARNTLGACFLCNAYLYMQRAHYSVRHSKSYCLPECPIPMIPSSADGPSCPVQPLVTT